MILLVGRSMANCCL
nr:unnamed protein product [Callosobruchus analis]